ncbi:site-specific integrase, partial [Bacillus sp. JJ722]
MTTSNLTPQLSCYEQLLEKVDSQLLHLRDAREAFFLDKIDETGIKYYINNVVDKPWNNHFFLYLIVGTERKLNARTIEINLSTINARLVDLFEYFHLTEIEQLNTETHLYEYFKGTIFENHSNSKRAVFLKQYR